MKLDVVVSKGNATISGNLLRRSRIAAEAVEARRTAFDRLVGALQEKHGWNRERASKELLRRRQKHRTQQS